MSFSSYINKYQSQFNDDIEEYVEKLLKEAWKEIITKSPVDTGAFRDNWKMSSALVGGQENPLFKIYAKHIIRGRSVYIYNDADYAWRLEYGWSQQAPRGIIRLTKMKLAREMR